MPQTTEKTADTGSAKRLINDMVEVGLGLNGKGTGDLFGALRLTAQIDPVSTFQMALSLIEDTPIEEPETQELSKVQIESIRLALRLAEPANFNQVCAAIAPILKGEKTGPIFKKVFEEERGNIKDDLITKVDLYVKNPRLVELELARPGIEKGIARRIVSRFNQLPLLRELFTNIRRSRGAYQRYRAVSERRSDFTQDQDGKLLSDEPSYRIIRKVTPSLVGLAKDPETRKLIRLALEEYIVQFKEAKWKELTRKSAPYVDEVVIGSGPTSANYRSTRSTLTPQANILAIDSRGVIGGQFAATDTAVFALNSRTRPEGKLTRESLPGTESPLNTLGPYAPLQQADISGDLYGTQSDFGTVIALNQLLAGDVLCGTSVKKIERASEKEQGRYKLTLENLTTGEVGYIVTDRVVSARGLGEPQPAIDIENKQTREVYEEERAKGETSRYKTAAEFTEMLGNPANPYPLQDVKTISFIGDGDSAKALIEAVLGLGPEIGISSATLDRLEKVYWYGQDSKTKEEFESCTRDRYVRLALEFPRKNNKKAPNRIIPVAQRAKSLSITEDGELKLNGDKRYAATTDLIVDCAGYSFSDIGSLLDNALKTPSPKKKGETTRKKATSKTLSSIKASANSPSGINESIQTCRGVIFRAGSRKIAFSLTTEYLEYDTKFTLRPLSTDKIGRTNFPKEIEFAIGTSTRTSLSDLKARLRDYILQNSYASYGDYGYAFIHDQATMKTIKKELEESLKVLKKPQSDDVEYKTQLDTLSGEVNGKKVAIAKKVQDQEIYILGPESQLPLSAEEKRKSGVNLIRPNLVAVFLYSPKVTSTAELLSEDLSNQPTSSEKKFERIPIFASNSKTDIATIMDKQEENTQSALPFDIDAERALVLYTQYLFRNIDFSALSRKNSVTVELRRTGQDKSRITLKVGGIVVNPELKKVLKDKLTSSRYFAELCSLVTSPPYTPRSNTQATVKVEIPIRDQVPMLKGAKQTKAKVGQATWAQARVSFS